MSEESPPLGPEWFARDAEGVARDLLGAQLCVRGDAGVRRAQVTEVEAYVGAHDRACHAHKGRTARTEVMFGPAGVWYVYLCYGVHRLANIVTGAPDEPAAVLLRGVGEWTGPGRLTRALAVTGAFNGCPATPKTGLWFEVGSTVPETEVERGPRVGIDYAGPEWAAAPLRFRWMAAWQAPGRKRRL